MYPLFFRVVKSGAVVGMLTRGYDFLGLHGLKKLVGSAVVVQAVLNHHVFKLGAAKYVWQPCFSPSNAPYRERSFRTRSTFAGPRLLAAAGCNITA